jgi:hypothetical protein
MDERKQRGFGSSSHGDFAREEYQHVLFLNMGGLMVNALLAIFILAWLVDSIWLLDSSMDQYGVILLPLFCVVCLTLPVCGLWLWRCFLHTSPSLRRAVAPVIVSLCELAFAAVGASITWLFIAQYLTRS